MESDYGKLRLIIFDYVDDRKVDNMLLYIMIGFT